MGAPRDQSPSEHEHAVDDHYNRLTESFYMNWNPEHIHWGLFEPGECPKSGEHLAKSEGLARAVERMVDVIVAPAGIEEHHHVVDAGCGVGGTAIRLAKMYGCAVTGINLNRMQLEAAGKKAIETNLTDRVGFEYADCSQNLPFADEVIDVIVNIESACHYSDRGQFLREVGRILKPGGRIVAMDWMVHDNVAVDHYEEYIQPLCECWAMTSLERQSTYTQLLQEAGLKVTEFEGFNGSEMDNLQILENSYSFLEVMHCCGIRAPDFIKQMERIWLLCEAWRKGYFEIRRYCATKPE